MKNHKLLKRIRTIIFFIAAVLIFLTPVQLNSQCTGCGLSYDEAIAYTETLEMIDMVEIPMRDGITLAGRVYFPDLPKKDLPTVLVRSSYFIPRSDFRWFAPVMAIFLKNGYAVVVNNERGRYWSEGHYTFLAGAKNDGYDVIE